MRGVWICGLVAGGLALEGAAYRLLDWNQVQVVLYRFCEQVGWSYNTTLVLLGTGLLGLASGMVGTFGVLRRRALVGDAVSHATLPGLCLAFMLFHERNFWAFLAGALLSGLLGIAIISWLKNNTRIKADAAIGIVLACFFGLGISLSRMIQSDPSGRQAGLDSYLLGKTAGMVAQDLLCIALVALHVVVAVLLLFKEFQLLSFDPDFALVQGWPVLPLDLLLTGLMVITTVIGLPAVGVVLMAALLIMPGVSARFWTERLDSLLMLSGALGLATGVLGTWLSAQYSQMPAGPMIVLTGTAIFLASALAAPRRGVLARLLVHWRFEHKIAEQNLLRSLYELSEHALPVREALSEEQLLRHRGWRREDLLLALRLACRKNEVQPLGAAEWVLTEVGLQRAAEVVRSHRLWELFLVEEASVAPDHVDRDADEIEHVLSTDLAARLEEKLKTQGRWPQGAAPASVHPVRNG